MGLETKAAFVHLPLDVSQTAERAQGLASLPTAISADALHVILAELASVG
jgi:hypothetical protein